MSEMKVPPPDGSKPSGKAEGTKGEQAPPQGSEFARMLEEMGAKPSETQTQPSSPLKPEQKKTEEKKKEKPKEKGKVEQQTGQQKQDVPVQIKTGGAAGKVQVSPQIERIADIFRANPIFGATVHTITAEPTATGANIVVQLNNGVMVNINLTGARDINVSVLGVSAAAQAAMENKENQNFLRGQLQQQGFVLHKFETFRSEAPQTEARGERGEGGEQEGEEEEQR